MARLVRKNLMVDAGALHSLARQRGTSESAAVRDAVANALAAQEMANALMELHEMGAFADYEQLFGEPKSELSSVAEAKSRAKTYGRRPAT
jgi:hypothetical protein